MGATWHKKKALSVNNTSGYTGVSFHQPSGKWAASIRFKGEYFYLGKFVKKEDAIRKRKKAEEEFNAKRAEEIIGKIFGRLTILERINEQETNGAYLYRCKCECGKTVRVTLANLKGGRVKSCGCMLRDKEAK
jgi:hypothetical protein